MSHARGSIVRLTLQNFLTFDAVEIKPSAQLNVIVGPNGTGKSSIVCAICIALGGSTKLLGRARETKDFVKHGKKDGFVEIELYETNKHAGNVVIKRKICADDNSSTWFINGRPSRLSEVTKKVEKMNIQLQNKCVFLPQDMVVEFARMNMFQRLEETEQAIGPRGMFETHTELKNLQSTYSKVVSELKCGNKLLEEEKRKNQLLERDVVRFKNRQEYITKIRRIKLKIPWLEYEEARNDAKTKKSKRKETASNMRKIKGKYQPIKDKLKVQDDIVKKYKEEEQKNNRAMRDARTRVVSLQEELVLLEDKLQDPILELEQSKKDEEERKKNIITLRREIQGLEQELAALEPQESIVKKIHSVNDQTALLQQEISDIADQSKELIVERERYIDIIRRNEYELKTMQDARSQRLQLLQKHDHWAYNALMWLSNNQQKFKQPILEPVMVSVNVLDPKYTRQVEAFLRGKDFYSFVAQNEDDKELFLQEVRDRMKLKVNVVLAPDQHLQDMKPQIPFPALRSCGFEKLMIDLIAAPEPLMCFFCKYHHLHQVPIAGDLPPNQIERIMSNFPQLRQFFTSTSRYSVTPSMYRKASSTRVRELMRPVFLVANVDINHKVSLEREIQETLHCRNTLDNKYSALKVEDEKQRQKVNKLLQEKNSHKKVIDQRKSYNGNLASRRTRLGNLSSCSFNLEEAEEKCEQAVEKIQHERVSCFGKIKDALKEAYDVTADCVNASLRVSTCELWVSRLVQEYQDVKSLCDNAEEELETIKQKAETATKNAKHLMEKAQTLSGVSSPNDNPEMSEQFKLLSNDLNELLEEVHDFQAQADMCDGTDSSVVDEYEKRKKDISKLEKEVECKQTDLDTRNQRIAKLKEEWLTPLKELVSGVSDNFRHFFSSHTQMEAAGEVCLVEHEDFSKYGVEIKVKFRDSEKLQALSAQRQSGGERSVSTMLYLMALQGTMSCPFRVVDEINQGMDPVNERHVFNLIVKAAAEGAQYFLLTPKLLQNLEYSEAVQVNSVFNGQEVMPYSEFKLEEILR